MAPSSRLCDAAWGCLWQRASVSIIQKWALALSLSLSDTLLRLFFGAYSRNKKKNGKRKELQTPLLGFSARSNASITLPFSSATSRTQSDLPVATSTCVAHPLTCPYSSSFSSILKFRGYWIEQEAQSCKQSSPSTSGETLGNRSGAAEGP